MGDGNGVGDEKEKKNSRTMSFFFILEKKEVRWMDCGQVRKFSPRTREMKRHK